MGGAFAGRWVATSVRRTLCVPRAEESSQVVQVVETPPPVAPAQAAAPAPTVEQPEAPPAVAAVSPPKEGVGMVVGTMATAAEVGEEAARRAAAEGKSPEEIEQERIRAQQRLNAAVATAERRSNERPGVMKRARWGATHRIHEHFVDGFPELEERFVRERDAAERRFEYNLGSRNFASKREGEEGIDTLKVLFRKLDRAIGLRDANMVQSIREEFLAELRHWNWRKGARVEFKRRKMVQNKAHSTSETRSDEENDERDKSPSAKDEGDKPAAPATGALLVEGLPPKGSAEDDSSVDDLDADDVNAIDDRVRRVSPEASVAVKNAAKSSDRDDRLQVAAARRHLLAESVAVALVALKWRAMRPHDLEQMQNEADKLTATNAVNAAMAAAAASASEA